MSVLIIEDNRDLVQVLAEVLNENGFSVESAHTGEEGLEKALLSRFDCIILDIVLPGINGFQVVEEYRKEDGSCRYSFCPPATRWRTRWRGSTAEPTTTW